jgi:transglutaminase-like putative cysteine protease
MLPDGLGACRSRVNKMSIKTLSLQSILGVTLAGYLIFSLTDSRDLFHHLEPRDTEQDDIYPEFLRETEHLDFRHSIFATVLSRVTSENMPIEKILEVLYYHVRDRIPFDPSASGQKASDYLIQNKAICYHKAMIYVCFCRLLKIPARVAEERFVIREDPKYPGPNNHGVAKIFFKDRWIYVDTVSNQEAWRWWVTKGAESFEPPKFTLERNVIPDTAFLSSIAFVDFDTNDVPRHWLN